MAGRQEGYEGSHWHHLHCGDTTAVTDVPGGLTGSPLPQFPHPALGLQPLPAAPHTGPAAARLLPATPRDWRCRDPGPKTGGAGERTAAPPHGAEGPGRHRETLGPAGRGLPLDKLSRAFPSEAELSRAESCRAKPSLVERSRVLPRKPSLVERNRALPQLYRARPSAVEQNPSSAVPG